MEAQIPSINKKKNLTARGKILAGLALALVALIIIMLIIIPLLLNLGLTTIFSDGFEAGFSKWDSVEGDPYTTTYTAHHGTHAMQTTTDQLERVHKTFTGRPSVNVRAYIEFANMPRADGNVISILELDSGIGNQPNVIAGVKNDSGVLKWGFTHIVGGAPKFASWPHPDIASWYCIELRVALTADGYYRELLLDGRQILNDTYTSANCHNLDEVFVGGWDKTPGDSITTWTDCVVVAETVIGPEHSSWSNGFESGEMSAWDGIQGSPIVVSDMAYQSNRSLWCSTTEDQYVTKLYNSTMSADAMVYVRFDSFPPTDGGILSILDLHGSSDAPPSVAVGVKNDSGTIKWGFTYQDGRGKSFADTPNPVLRTWYSLELNVTVLDSHHYYAEIFVDGSSVLNETASYSLGDLHPLNGLLVGGFNKQSSAVGDWIDCVVVANYHVGSKKRG